MYQHNPKLLLLNIIMKREVNKTEQEMTGKRSLLFVVGGAATSCCNVKMLRKG